MRLHSFLNERRNILGSGREQQLHLKVLSSFVSAVGEDEIWKMRTPSFLISFFARCHRAKIVNDSFDLKYYYFEDT